MNFNKSKCNGCKVCEKNCKMNVKITKNINSLECIRCGDCKKVCKQNAITSGVTLKPSNVKIKDGVLRQR